MAGTRSHKWIILLGTVAVLCVSYLTMTTFLGTNADLVADEIGYMLRVTARLAFMFLLLAMLARPLARLCNSSYLLRNRRYLGLAMAFVHTVHFGYVVSLVTVLGQELEWVTIVFGGLAFVLMWLMAATSNNPSMRLLGPWWGRLHTFGLYYLWLIFMQSFVPRALNLQGDWLADTTYVLLVFVGAVALLLRLGGRWFGASAGTSARTT